MNLDVAARACQVSRRWLYKWMARGMLRYTEPRRWRRQVQRADVEAAKVRCYRKVRFQRKTAA